MAGEEVVARENREREDALIAFLVELRRRKERRGRLVGNESETAYQRVLSHFERRGNRLRGEKLVTEELINRIFNGTEALPPALPQRELVLDGVVGGTAVGRFRVVNQAPSQVVVELLVGDADLTDPLPIMFTPDRPVLAPGESALVRVSVDLTAWRSPRSATVVVECRAGARRDRIWLIVNASGEGDR